jgi:hypothetical protein
VVRFIVYFFVLHPGMYVMGRVLAHRGLLAHGEHGKGTVPLVGSWVCALCLVISLSLGERNQVAGCLYLMSGPLCCFFSGVSYGLVKHVVRLIPLGMVLLIFITFLASYGLPVA